MADSSILCESCRWCPSWKRAEDIFNLPMDHDDGDCRWPCPPGVRFDRRIARHSQPRECGVWEPCP